MQTSMKLSLAAALTAGLVLSACGGAGTSGAADTTSTVSGVVSADVELTSVALRDSSSPAHDATADLGPDGAFSIDVATLTPPFVLRAEDATGHTRLYAIALRPGVTDVNQLSSAAASAAGHRGEDGEDGDEETWDDEGKRRDACLNIDRVIRELSTVLQPLFDLYHVTPFAGHGDDDDDDEKRDGDWDEDTNREALRALLRDVSFTVQARSLVVTNRLTGAVIYTAPLKDLTSGAFHPENMPPGPGGTPGTTCSSFTYSAWSPAVCDASGVQTRTVLTSSPSGCTGGAPVVSQTCSPPTPGTCTSFTYSAWSPAVCDASGVQTRTVLTSSPSGCTGGAPVVSQTCSPPTPGTCTSFTYSAWSPAVCDASGVQTRTVLTSSPSGCTGGAPVVSQTCSPPPTTCSSFTYSAWTPAVCDASGRQTRTVLTSSPSGCTGGAPVVSQTCSPPLDGAALYQQSCASCHRALATSNLKGKAMSVTSIKSAGMAMGRTDAELQAIVTAVGP